MHRHFYIYPRVRDLRSKMVLKFDNFGAYLQNLGFRAKSVLFFLLKAIKMDINVSFDVKCRRIQKKFANDMYMIMMR